MKTSTFGKTCIETIMTKRNHEQYIAALKVAFTQPNWELTESQWHLLALFAYTDGNEMTEYEILRTLRYPNTAQRDRDIAFLHNDRHLIERSPFSWRKSYTVRTEYYLRAALTAFLYFPDVTESAVYARHRGDSWRFKLVQCLAYGNIDDVPIIPMWNNKNELVRLFADIADEPAFEPIVRKLPEALLSWIADYKTLHFGDVGCNESLDATESFARKYFKGDVLVKTLAKLNGLRFFLDGKLRPAESREEKLSEWPSAIAAIITLYKGDYEKAGELFDAALKIRNKDARVKNVFDTSILAYFLILSYVLSDTDKSRKKLSQYLNKKFDDWQDCQVQLPGLLLANLTLGASDRYIGQLLQDSVAASDMTVRVLVDGIAKSRNLNMPTDELSKSSFAILRHEFGCGTPEEMSRLDNLFGGTSLLSRIRVKKPWEIALENLTSIVDRTKAASSDEKSSPQKDRRILYLVEYYGDLEVREQTRLRSGNWGQGKHISYSAFTNGTYSEIFDNIDRAAQARAFRRGYFSLESVLPALVGCDRVFLGSYAPANRIEINEELPYVEVKLKGLEYVFTTNVPKERYAREYSLDNIIKRDKLHYTIVSLNRVQAQLLQRIAESGVKFPKESETAMKVFITKLSTVIEVHSPLLETGSSLELRQGSVMMYFRIIPKSGSFNALLYVRPLENGKLTFYPGKGNAVFYDSDDVSRYQVKRDIKAERASLEMFLERTGLDAFDSEDGAYALAPEDMLPVLDACRGLGEICSLEWPEGRSLRVIGSVEPQKISINVRSKEQWFEVEGDVELSDGQSVTIEQIMSALSAGGYGNGYLKLGEDEYVALSESLAKYLKRLESVTQSGRGGERISMFQTGVLADIVKKSHLNVRTDKAYQARLARIEESSSLIPAVPGTLKAELRDYQEDGFRWMVRLDHWGAGACLADDMGLGKTVQTIAFLLNKAAVGASLVVAPASVLMNWSRELARFAPSLNVIVLNEQDDRADALSELGEYDIVLTTYGLLVREKDTLASVSWNVVCLDEAHTIKNRGTKMSDAAMALKASSRVILTGTPVQNYLGELWNLFQFLNPGLLGSYESFQRKFIAPIENSEDKDRQAQLKRIIQPFMLRRTKAEVVDELPEKTEIFRTVPMSVAETVAYETMRLEAKNELDADNKLNMNALAAITRLREAACAMSLVKNGWTEEPSKVAAVRELIGDIVSGGNSVLVFSQFTGFLDIVSAALEKDDIAHFYLQGSTPLKKRQEMVSEFQHGEKPVFLISLKAGGLGLNLTGANYVIHLDPWWNPAIEQQATDRAYRIGQQQNVTVYHLIAANTIEEKILRLHKTKQNLADAILEGTSKSHAITLDELRELLQ